MTTMNKTMKRALSVVLLGAVHVAAISHDGHGGQGESHGHATEIGFVLVIVLVMATILWGRRK